MFSEGSMCDRICLTQLSRLMWVTFVPVCVYLSIYTYVNVLSIWEQVYVQWVAGVLTCVCREVVVIVASIHVTFYIVISAVANVDV